MQLSLTMANVSTCSMSRKLLPFHRWLDPRLTIVCCLSLLAVTGCQTRTAPTSTAATQAPEGGAAATLDRVTTGVPQRKTLQLFTEQPGRVQAFEEAPILSKLPGYVDSVHFDIGDQVTKGAKLISLYAPEYEDQLQQKREQLGLAEAQVKQAQAAQAAAEAAANSAQAMVAQAEAAIGRATADYARWDSENQRIQQLVSRGSVTPKLADEATSQFQAAQAAQQEALAHIESAKAKLLEATANAQTAAADVAAAQAKLKVAAAEVAQAQTMANYTELLAPFDGYVIQRNVDAGHYVQPAGATSALPLMKVASLNQVRVFVNVPESEASWVSGGLDNPDSADQVWIQAAGNSAFPITARVTRTSIQLDPHSRSLTTEIDLDNSDLKLLPGAFVTAKILLEERPNVLTLPISAIVKRDNATYCCVVVDNQIQHKPLDLGLRVGDEVEIISGLDGGEAVVLVRADALSVGQKVEVIQKP